MDVKSRRVISAFAAILVVVASDCRGQSADCPDQRYLMSDRGGLSALATSRLTGHVRNALNWTSLRDVFAGASGARIVHFGESHGHSEEQSVVAAAIPALQAKGFSALFLEKRAQHQPAIDDYLRGSSTEDQLSSVIGHVESHPGRSVFASAKAAKLKVIAMDMTTTEATTTQEYMERRDRVMYERVLEYLRIRPNAKIVIFTGGEHAARRPNEWGASLGQLLDADFKNERISILLAANGTTDGLEHLQPGLLRKGMLFLAGNSSVMGLPLYWDAKRCDLTWRFGDWDYLLPVE